MFAVFQTGGKQYKVSQGDTIKVEKFPCEAGETVVFDQVLMVGQDDGNLTLGSPVVKDMKVAAEVLEAKKDKKIIIFKKKRRHNYRRKLGHRQEVVWLKVSDIGSGLKPKAKAADKKSTEKSTKKADSAVDEKAKSEVKKEKAPAKKPAAKKAPAKKAENKE